MAKPVCPKKAFDNWKKTEMGTSAAKIATVTPALLRSRLKLAFCAGFDSGIKAQRRKAQPSRAPSATHFE